MCFLAQDLGVRLKLPDGIEVLHASQSVSTWLKTGMSPERWQEHTWELPELLLRAMAALCSYNGAASLGCTSIFILVWLARSRDVENSWSRILVARRSTR